MKLRAGRGIRQIDHGCQHLIINLDQLGGVHRLLECLGNHRHDMVADIAHCAVRQDRMWWLVGW